MTDPILVKMLAGDTRGWQSVVDYGCGEGTLLDALWHIPERIGIDIVQQRKTPPSWTFVEGDILTTAAPLTHGALVIDVIEHLPRKDGEAFIERLKERHETMILFTPKGFFPQEGTPKNPWQKHVSGWTVTDFTTWCCEVIELPLGDSQASVYARWDRSEPSLREQWRAQAGS